MKKTSNTQRRTLNIEWSADGFCRGEVEELIRIFAASVRTAAKK